MGQEKVVINFLVIFQYGVRVIEFFILHSFSTKVFITALLFFTQYMLVKVSGDLDDLFSNRYFQVLSEHFSFYSFSFSPMVKCR